MFNLQNSRMESWDHNKLIESIKKNNYIARFLIKPMLKDEIEKKINYRGQKNDQSQHS
jgi:hypothetical protein